MPDSTRLRLLYAGTPEFAAQPLEQMLKAGFRPLAVLTRPDRPAGRGRKLQASPVKKTALNAGIRVHQPDSLRDPSAQSLVAGYEADLMIVVAYGLILPAEVLRLPRFGCWNVHASLLPRWRGAAPIQRAIEAGDRESGVSIMQMDEGLDTGPVLYALPAPIGPEETGGSLHDRLAALGAEALLNCLQRLARGEPPEPVLQERQGISYAEKLSKNEARIDWTGGAERLERKIRAFDPWPVAWCMIGPERTRIWRARVVDGAGAGPPGQVLAAGSAGIDVATGKGVLRLLELQRPGGRRVSATDYLNAASLPDRLDGDA
jgi:methionyl-tRNA formyltransferase